MTEPDTMVVHHQPISSPPRAHLLRRVLSQGSNGSAATISHTLDPTSPGSPSAGGRTPKAKKAVLKEANTPAGSSKPRKASGEALASDLNQLNVRSPMAMSDDLPDPTQDQVMGMSMENGHSHQGNGNGNSYGNGHDRTYSSSTEGSENHPIPPSQLGSVYGADGFPLYGMTGPTRTSPDVTMTPAAMAAVAAADEAIKQLNGTSTVFHNLPSGSGTGENPYALPRGFAGFTRPPPAPLPNRTGDHFVTRQSSTSSNATEASTSSEESDLCIPTIEWVTRADAIPTPGQSWNSPFLPQSPRNGARNSPARMPPPTTTGRGVASPRRSNGATLPNFSHQGGLPVGASAQTPGGLAGSALPSGVEPTAVAEDEDDDATVGHGRDRSSSTSSQSAQSGLDLLWAAANQPKRSGSAGDQDNKGKRKAGAEAVAQWRTSGIPSGVKPSSSNGRRDSAYSETLKVEDSEPPKKRRRSEMRLEDVDPTLRDASMERGSESAMEVGSDYTEEEQGSEGDSEYGGGGGTGKTRKGAKARGGRKGGRARLLSNENGKAGGGMRKGRKTESPSGAKGGSRRGSAAVPGAGTVRCEYINPLPPYNRCQDVFTRRYDLPRHMARHARREGELVMEGKLAEEKAVLWKTIKDKPKVQCPICNETFTRMDALKRHQAKQHH